MSPSDTLEHNAGTVESAGTVQSPSTLQTIEGAGIAALEAGAADMATGRGPIAAAEDAALAGAQAANVPERIAALEQHIPVVGTILTFLQSMFPHSPVATVSMPAPAGDTTPATPPPQPHWNGQAWVLPAEPETPPPAPVWDQVNKRWTLPA